MAREDRKKKGGRVTPKGGAPKGGAVPLRSRQAVSKGHAATDTDHAPSRRYTAPVPHEMKVSPLWVPVLMFTLLGAGALVIVLNYLGLLPGATDNRYLLVGLGAVLGGIITATQYH